MMTGKQYLMSIAGGALLGGTVNGITALANGRNFMTGNLPSSNAPIQPTVTQPTQNTGTQQGQAQQQTAIPNQNNSFSVTTAERPQMLSVEGQNYNINPPRPQIAGYESDVLTKTGLSHKFPYSFDEIIVQGGDFSFTSNGNYWYVASGSINTGNGWYSIGVRPNGTIFHRGFSNYYPFAK
jgi:hypothetical protein